MRAIPGVGLTCFLCLTNPAPALGHSYQQEDPSQRNDQQRTQRDDRTRTDSSQGRGRSEGFPSSTLPAPIEDLEKLEGKVMEVIPRARRGPTTMVDVRLRSGKRETLIRLGPAGFLQQKGFSVEEGDVLSVTGYRMTSTEGKLLVATEVRKGDMTLHLRDSPGRPAWKKPPPPAGGGPSSPRLRLL